MKFLYDHFEHLSKNGSLQDFEECIKYIDLSNQNYDFFVNVLGKYDTMDRIQLLIKHGGDIHYNNDILLGVAIERGNYGFIEYLMNVHNLDVEKLKGCNAYSKYHNELEKYEEFASDLVFHAPLDDLIAFAKKNKIDVNRNNADSVKTFMGRDDVKLKPKLFVKFYVELNVRKNTSILSRASECGYLKIVQYLVEHKYYNPDELKGCTSYTNVEEVHEYFLSLSKCRVCKDACSSQSYRCRCCHEPLCRYCYENYGGYCKHGCRSHGPIDCDCSDSENDD